MLSAWRQCFCLSLRKAGVTGSLPCSRIYCQAFSSGKLSPPLDLPQELFRNIFTWKLEDFYYGFFANVSPFVQLSYLKQFLTSSICDNFYQLKVIHIISREETNIQVVLIGISLQSHQCTEKLEKNLKMKEAFYFFEEAFLLFFSFQKRLKTMSK